MLQADLGLFLLFYDKSRFAGVFILVFSVYLFASCGGGLVWKKRLPPFSGAALLKIQANTTTKNGLAVACQVDPREYEKGKKISDETMAAIDLEPVGEFGKWNYKIRGFLPSSGT